MKNPRKILYNKFLFLLKGLFKLYPYFGINVLNENWDILIILDACRYDFFKKYNFIKGKLKKKKSLGSCTREWIKKNFIKNYSNIVYISGNPHISKFMLKKNIGRNPFYYIDEVWNYGWNDEFGTVLPDIITKRIIENLIHFPNKKIVAHYMQPHSPFIKEKNLIDIDEGWRNLRNIVLSKKAKKEHTNIFKLAHIKKVNINSIKKGYIENLKIVLKSITKLKNLKKQIIITSDHGNCFGEYGLYGHPCGIYIPQLIEIPWFSMNMYNNRDN